MTTKTLKATSWFLASPIRLLIVPYAAGLLWHGLHPISSVLTGDVTRPRQIYIDENSLDPSHFDMKGAAYDLIQQTRYNSKKYGFSAEKKSASIKSLCQGVRTFQNSSAFTFVHCHRFYSDRQGISFEVAKIQPSSAGIVPDHEAIVLVVPAFEAFFAELIRTDMEMQAVNINKSRWQFQASVLQLIRRLSSKRTSAWLAKSVLVVSPVVGSYVAEDLESASQTSLCPILERTVESFLDVYLGKLYFQHIQRSRIDQRLPIDYTGAVLRNLIVLDLELFERENRHWPLNGTVDFPSEVGELRILTQGRRGILPNMDLTAMVRAVYERSSSMLGQQQLDQTVKKRYKLVKLVVHPHQKNVTAWLKWLDERGLPAQLREWTYKMLHLLAFEHAMVIGPYPPHAPALERGIDALTIQGVFPCATDEDDFDVDRGNTPRSKLSPQQYPLELVQKMEYVIRALSNLHERLHHSTSLYMLPSPDRFVKHEEYLIPTLLLIIPLVIRALLIVFHQDRGPHNLFWFDFFAAGQAIIVCLSMSLALAHKIEAFMVDDKSRSVEWNERIDLLMFSICAPWLKERLSRILNLLCSERGWYKTQFVALPELLSYIFVLALISSHRCASALRLSDVNARRSIQLATCILATCMHIAIAFGHTSLAFASAFLWTPLLAFPSQNWRRGRSRNSTKVFLFFLSCPFTGLPLQLFLSHTVYCRYVYLPLHLLFSLLLLTESKT